jgi:hypothetical protein
MTARGRFLLVGCKKTLVQACRIAEPSDDYKGATHPTEETADD